MSETSPARRAGAGRWALVGVAGLAGLLGLAWFTLHLAAPNVIIAGQKATEKQAVHALRTLRWAQEKFIERYGRAGTLAELAGRAPLDPPLRVALVRNPLDVPVALPGGGEAAAASGYLFRVDPQGRTWTAIAWPEKRGASGQFAFCINEFEDIVESPADAPGQGYDGLKVVPAARACVVDGAARLAPGQGADGGTWQHWRGRQTRRARGESGHAAP